MIKADQIDWSLLDQIENPEQKKFFQNVKKNLESGVTIDPDGFVQSLGPILGNNDPEMYEKLKKVNNDMKKLTSALKSFNM